MDAQLRSMLNETEQALLRAVQPRELKRLDEDALTELHDRIRRARNKYSKLYRRRASDRVASDRSRGRASAANAKAARKAEGFEDALAKVSERLAQVAAAAAEEMNTQTEAMKKYVAELAAVINPSEGESSTSFTDRVKYPVKLLSATKRNRAMEPVAV